MSAILKFLVLAMWGLTIDVIVKIKRLYLRAIALIKRLYSSNIVLAILVWVFAQAVDISTSYLGSKHGLSESNEFARNKDLTFNTVHGLAIKSVYFVIYGVVSLVGYKLASKYSKKAAEIVAMLPFLYLAYSGFMAGAQNLFLVIFRHWQVEDPVMHFILR